MNEEILPDLGLEVGDKVEYAGVEGEVVWVSSNGAEYPIGVKFKPDMVVVQSFLSDGRAYRWHKIPSLKLIEKKIKPKKKITLYRHTYKSTANVRIYQTDWTTDKNGMVGVITTETKEIEID